jgi:mono/diheme cytochrome c family protein
MKFVAGLLTAFIFAALTLVLAVVTGAFNVSATVPNTGLESLILSNTMAYSIRLRAGRDVTKAWNQDQLRNGFEEYDEMCKYCHGAPGKEANDISKGLNPRPPNLAEASPRWNNAELFWIIKNGVRMTGMPAFGPTHDDNTIWNIVGFVRQLPKLSANDYSGMRGQSGPESHEHDH